MRARFCALVFVAITAGLTAAASSPETAVAKRSAEPELVRPLWSYPVLGNNIGAGGIATGVTTSGDSEIYVMGAPQYSNYSYWAALAYDGNGGYDPVFASEYFSEGLSALTTGDVTGASNVEILAGLANGVVHLYDLNTKTWLGTFSTTATVSNSLHAMKVHDLDGSGKSEVIVSGERTVAVYQDGVLSWQVDGAGGALAIAQMDGDPQLEIATGSGKVIDTHSRSVQWDSGQEFGWYLAAADIDGDSIDELVGRPGGVAAWDVDQKTRKWIYFDPNGVSSIAVADADSNGSPEVIVGQDQWGEIICLDPDGRVAGWKMPNPGHGVAGVAVADSDRDGVQEVLWATRAEGIAGAGSLNIGNPLTQTLEWHSIPSDGALIGPEVGDLDGDGYDELVVGTGARGIMVFDALTLKLRATSLVNSNGTSPHLGKFRLRDVDNDGDQEIVAIATRVESFVQVLDFHSSNTFSLKGSTPPAPFSTYLSDVDARDIDGDGNIEIIAGARKASTGGDGRYLYIYDYQYKFLEWKSEPTNAYWSGTELEIGDLIPGGGLEILANTSDGVYVIDGYTKAVKTLIRDYYSTLQIKDGVLYASDSEGWLWELDWNGSYFLTSRIAQLSSSSLGGMHLHSLKVLSTDPLVVRYCEDGKMGLFSNGVFVSETPSYGFEYGFAGADGVAAGDYCITADYLPAPVLSVEPAKRDVQTTWTRVVGDIEYLVQASTDPQFETVSDSGWMRGRRHNFRPLEYGKTHYYRVKARLAGGNAESQWSRVVTSAPVSAPAAAKDWTLYQ